MRKVQVFKIVLEPNPEGARPGAMKNFKRPDFIGTFHQFGQDDNSEGMQVPVALVEAADGSVRSVHVEMIQFIEPIAMPVSHAELVAALREAARYGIGKWEFDGRPQDEIDGAKWASDQAVDSILARLDAA